MCPSMRTRGVGKTPEHERGTKVCSKEGLAEVNGSAKMMVQIGGELGRMQ